MHHPQATTPCSPLTRGPHVSHWEGIPVVDVAAAYQKIGVDVSWMFPDIDAIQVFRCNETGYRFYYPLCLAAGPEFYALLQRSMPYYAEWRWEHNYASELLIRPGKLLEIGCGTGNFLYRIAGLCRQDVVGSELSDEALQAAPQRALAVHPQTISEFADLHPAEFATVCSFHVLEHVPDVAGFLEAACRALHAGGTLILAVPNSNPYYCKHDRLHALNLPPHHMGLWDRNSLAKLAHILPLELVSVQASPLDDPGFYWDVYLNHIRTSNQMLHTILSRLPWRVQRLILAAIRRYAEGPNLVAVYTKRPSDGNVPIESSKRSTGNIG